jgi:hypothetical protein
MNAPVLIAVIAAVTGIPTDTVATSKPPRMVGNCVVSSGSSLDLHKLLLLEDRSAVVDGSQGKFRVTLVGEAVEIVDLIPESAGVFLTNIGYEVEPRNDIDVELKFAVVSNEFVLYWKETYQHRICRQGLFRFVNRRPVALCQGRGGTTSYE